MQTVPENLTNLQQTLFGKLNLEISNLQMDKESSDYSAYSFSLNNLKIIFRVAKTTPTKTGQFVTLWKRIEKNPIQPYDFSDDIDFIVINTQNEVSSGLFIFPKSILSQKGVISTISKEGKRAIRIYSPWDKTESKQAEKTKQWQLNYFLDLSKNEILKLDKAKLLLCEHQQ